MTLSFFKGTFKGLSKGFSKDFQRIFKGAHVMCLQIQHLHHALRTSARCQAEPLVWRSPPRSQPAIRGAVSQGPLKRKQKFI